MKVSSWWFGKYHIVILKQIEKMTLWPPSHYFVVFARKRHGGPQVIISLPSQENDLAATKLLSCYLCEKMTCRQVVVSLPFQKK
jgi:hypothetical protein